jgi:hypothetical protein
MQDTVPRCWPTQSPARGMRKPHVIVNIEALCVKCVGVGVGDGARGQVAWVTDHELDFSCFGLVGLFCVDTCWRSPPRNARANVCAASDGGALLTFGQGQIMGVIHGKHEACNAACVCACVCVGGGGGSVEEAE